MPVHFKNEHNPILPLEFHIPDSEGHVMPDGRLYLYGSYDNSETAFCSDEYHVVSTADLVNWTFHDVSFRGEEVPWFKNPDAVKYPGIDWSHPTPFILKMMENINMDTAKESLLSEAEPMPLLFAPDCIYKDGKYYLYFCMVDDSEGVAVSDKPEGPFTNPVQLPCGGIDPAVFIDDDGKAYFYWGQLFSHGVELNPDMLSFDESKIVHNLVTEEEHFFHEGSSMRKIGNTYYLVYANIEHGKPTSLGYATSKSPLDPFKYRGIIIDNAKCDPQSWNNHGSIECVNGQWYVFYHRCSRGGQLHRRLCVEPITILEDGCIPEVVMTSQGPGKPFGLGEKIYGFQACEVSGTTRIDLDGRGSEWLTQISDGDTAVFRYLDCKNDVKKVVMETQGKGTVRICINQLEAGVVDINNTERSEVTLSGMHHGIHEVILKFEKPEKLSVKAITFV